MTDRRGHHLREKVKIALERKVEAHTAETYNRIPLDQSPRHL